MKYLKLTTLFFCASLLLSLLVATLPGKTKASHGRGMQKEPDSVGTELPYEIRRRPVQVHRAANN